MDDDSVFSSVNGVTQTCQTPLCNFVVPTVEFNAVYQLVHIYRHLFNEGIGLRQLLDYYFVIEKFAQEGQTPMYKNEVLKQMKRFGMERFAGAMMYVLKKAFAMPDEYLLCDANKKEGRFLLEEIMIAGNFGHHDPRMETLEVKKGKTTYQVKRAWRRVKRNMHFVGSYPAEVMWEPIARIEHLVWRKLRLWRF